MKWTRCVRGREEGAGVEVGGSSIQNAAKHLHVIPCSMLLLLCGISPDPPCPLHKEASQMQAQMFLCMYVQQSEGVSTCNNTSVTSMVSHTHTHTMWRPGVNHYSFITLFTSYMKLNVITNADDVTVWKAETTCIYTYAVRHLHARAQVSPCGSLQLCGRGCWQCQNFLFSFCILFSLCPLGSCESVAGPIPQV